MQITQAELDRYRLQLARQQSDAKAYIVARLESEPGIADMPVADVRDRTVEIMKDCLGVYGDQAQALSAELFDEISEAEGLGASPAQIFDGLIDDDMMEEKVRYYARAIAGDEPDWEGYEGSNADLASYYVHRSAMQNMARNCDRNDVRYARVATGRDSCGFCFMLSSRGFDYRSSETATAASHPHCDCIIVPGKKGKTRIEGYEPESMRERWAECYRAIGGRDQLSHDRDSLTKKEKAAYKGKTEAVRRDDYIRKRIQAECETRSSEWLYRGNAPKVDYSRNPMSSYGRLKVPGDYSRNNIVDRGNEWADLWAHHALSENGFSIEAYGHEDIDLKINGQWWEVKSPSLKDSKTDDGKNLGFVESDLRKAIRQFKKRGISDTRVVFNSKYRAAPDDAIRDELLDRMQKHGVNDVLFVRKDGFVERLSIGQLTKK